MTKETKLLIHILVELTKKQCHEMSKLKAENDPMDRQFISGVIFGLRYGKEMIEKELADRGELTDDY